MQKINKRNQDSDNQYFFRVLIHSASNQKE